MIWRWTGVIAAGHRVKEPVATIDLTATLQELFHFDDLDSLQGQSQPPEARPSEGTPPEALAIEGHFSNRPILSQRAIGADHHVALTRGNFRLHARFIKEPLEEGAEFELFDILKDPTEQRNIKERHPLVVTNMRETIRTIWSESQAIHSKYRLMSKPTPATLNKRELRRLRSLGYVK